MLCTSILFVAALLFSSLVKAQGQNVLQFQGKIVNGSNGTNVGTGNMSCIIAGNSNDTCDFRVRIYTAQTGGSLLWSETHSNLEIGAYNGIFNLDVNSICNSWGIGACSASGVDWTTGSKYIQIEVDTDGNGDFVGAEVFERDLITGAAYAQYSETSNNTLNSNDSDNLDGIDSSGFVQKQPGSAQTATGTTPLIFLNETGVGTPDLMRLQMGGNNMFRVDNNGAGHFASGIVLGNYTSSTTGAIRWSGSDFEGYDGSSWVSLTSGGGSTDFLGLSDTPNSYAGSNSYILRVNAGGTGIEFVNASTYTNTDAQTLSLGGNNLAISGGNSVSLLPYLDNTDSQGISVASNILSITGSATTVNLTPYLDNTDAQTLSFVGTNLSISNGNTVDLSSLQTGTGNFIGLTDTPVSYAGSMGYLVRVNAGETGVEFVDFNTLIGSNYFVQNGNSFGTGAVIGTNDNNALALETNGVTRVTVTNTGNVGIGTNTPNGRLDVNDSSTGASSDTTAIFTGVYNPSGAAPGPIYQGVVNSLTLTGGDGTVVGSATGLNVIANNANTGDVTELIGINVSSSQNGLGSTVYDQYGIKSETEVNTTATNGYGFFNEVSGTGSIGDLYGIYNDISVFGGISTNEYGLFSTDGVTDVYLNYLGDYSVYTDDVARYEGGIVFGNNVGTEEGTVRFTGTDLEGYVGGQWRSLTNVDAFIQNGNSFGTAAVLGTNDNFNLNFETNGTTKVVVENTGNVGIGEADPDAKLEISNDDTDQSSLEINQEISGWSTQYSGTGVNVTSMIELSNGEILVGGGANNFVARFSANGQIIRSYSAPGVNTGYISLFQTSSDTVIGIGARATNDTWIKQETTQIDLVENTYATTAFYGFAAQQLMPQVVIRKSNGNFLVGGFVTISNAARGYIMELNSNGTTGAWRRYFGDTAFAEFGSLVPEKMVELDNGEIFFVGDGFLGKLQANGVVSYLKYLSGSGNYDILHISDDNLFVFKGTQIFEIDYTNGNTIQVYTLSGLATGTQQVSMLKNGNIGLLTGNGFHILDTNFSIISSHTLTSSATMTKFIETRDGGIVFAGSISGSPSTVRLTKTSIDQLNTRTCGFVGSANSASSSSSAGGPTVAITFTNGVFTPSSIASLGVSTSPLNIANTCEENFMSKVVEVDSGGNLDVNGDITGIQINTGNVNIENFDVAEEYDVEDLSIGAGDVVRFKKDSANKLVVERAGGAGSSYDKDSIGVISTEPGLYLKEWSEDKINGRPVALAGRVPVKVNLENGPIKRGDYLTASSTPGYAMKADKGGIVIGRAMEDFGGGGDSVLVEQEIVEEQEEAEEIIEEAVEAGELSNSEAEVLEEKYETQVVEGPALQSFSDGGRIMMYVDLGYVGEEVYESNETVTEGVEVMNAGEQSLMTYFEVMEGVDGKVSMGLKGDLKVEGTVSASKYSGIDGSIVVDLSNNGFNVYSVNGEKIFGVDAGGKVEIKEGENSSVGRVTIEAGNSQIFVKNTRVTSNSKIFISFKDSRDYTITNIQDGSGFTVELPIASDATVHMDYWIVN